MEKSESFKIVTCIEFLRDVDKFFIKGMFRELDEYDKISKTHVGVCCGHGVFEYLKIGVDCKIFKKKITTTITEEIIEE